MTTPALLSTYEADLESGDDLAREHLNAARMRYYQELEGMVTLLEQRKREAGREPKREVSTVHTPDNLRRVSCSSESKSISVRMTPGASRPASVDTSCTDSCEIYQQVLFGSSWCPQTPNQPPPTE